MLLKENKKIILRIKIEFRFNFIRTDVKGVCLKLLADMKSQKHKKYTYKSKCALTFPHLIL